MLVDLGGNPPLDRLDSAPGEVDDGGMTATGKDQGSDTSQEADSKPVDKKPRKKRLHYVNMTNNNSADVPACVVCGAARYYISTGAPSSARMFTPHQDKCGIPARVFITPERLADYASRKADFLNHYSERLSRYR